MLEYFWYGVAAVAIAVILWKFGVKAAVLGALALFGIKLLRDERERGRADERADRAKETEDLRNDWDRTNKEPHSPSDAFEHLRGLSKRKDRD